MSDVVVGTVPKSPAKGGSSPYKVYRQGFLLKCQPRAVRKKLHRYWFVLFKQKDMLAFLYFQDEDHYLERKKNEGFFRIDDCTSIDVIPEHMGRKNSFCITTPRAKYNLVSESRYELHHWLLALHGAIEDYRNITAESSTSKKKSRNRSQSTTSPPGTSSQSKTYPRIKPSRPAPPAPPKDKRKGDEENIPPSLSLDRQSQTTTTTTTTSNTMDSFQDLPSPTTNNFDNIVAGLIQQTQEQHTTLDYTLTEDEYLPMMNGGGGDEEQEGRTSGSFFTSMPILNSSDKDANTGEESTGNSDENGSPGPSHTRHLSFSDSQEFNGQHEGKKKISKKRASVKGRRSVSPPNLPPPPPPPTIGNEGQEPAEEYIGENVIKSFDQQDEFNRDQNVAKLSPKPAPPQRTTSLNPGQVNTSAGISSAEINQYLDEAFNEDDQLQQLQVDTTGSRSSGILRNKGAELSVTTKQVAKRTVAFEDNSTGRYEPMVDHESLPSTVAEAKMKLFGMQEAESCRYKRISTEPQDELLEAIESALQPTSYMEQGNPNPTKVGFTMEVNAPPPPQVPPPTRPPQELPNGGGRYSLQTSPKEPNPGQQNVSRWSNPSLDDTPTTSTFSSNQDTMYRSIV